MNEFSILCRVLGSLYYRQPQDPLLVPLFTLIREGKLAANWPLEQDELLTRLQKSCDMAQVSADYNALFIGDECAVPPYRSAWVEGATEAEVRAFLSETRDAISGYASRSHRYIAARGYGWKISQRKMRAKHWKHCSVSICYHGVVRSLVKWRPMQLRLLAHHGTANPRCY